ncbi:hypothetical protein KFE25_012921 [Diacronema lutheri]|uniref:Hydroxyproline O-arabinosyltransferase-like domain-containing protein n=1 Tax=Diacronema lutheri TaxID=2081491 RepID=A0A8J6C8S0_DIALT|nr:hypothetical protein KFE25_012921 [Diacronema lutheri]
MLAGRQFATGQIRARAMGRPQLVVVALVALGLLIFVQVLRVTSSDVGMGRFVSRSPISVQQRARALAALSAARPDAPPRAPAPQLDGSQRHDRERAPTPNATRAAALAARARLAEPNGLDACAYEPAADPRALGAGPHEPPVVPLSDTTTCPGRSPFHTLLTAQGTTYQGWQARIMYYHWRKQRAAAGRCTDMTGFTRLCASKDGAPDGLEASMPTIYIAQLPDELIRSHFGFGVLNRPHSLKVLLQTPHLLARITEEFVLIAETDHVLTRPLVNLATRTTPAAFVFGYMHAHAGVDWVVKKYWPQGSHARVQPIGPSPAMISKAQLATFVDDWLAFSLDLRSNADAEAVIQGWVQEMWGYSIAAAKAAVEHKLVHDFQIEPGAHVRQLAPTFWRSVHIFHFTYGIEFKMDGTPQGVNQIGEWSLDKRHYGGAYPPLDLEPPPAGANAAACWLLQAFNEAMSADPAWPRSRAFGTIGWRRACSPPERIAAHPVASRLGGSKWTWAGIDGLEFVGPCDVKTPWGVGKWGLQTRSRLCDADCVASSIFLDFSGAHHTVVFSPDLATFESTRVGDGEKVAGVRAAG